MTSRLRPGPPGRCHVPAHPQTCTAARPWPCPSPGPRHPDNPAVPGLLAKAERRGSPGDPASGIRSQAALWVGSSVVPPGGWWRPCPPPVGWMPAPAYHSPSASPGTHRPHVQVHGDCLARVSPAPIPSCLSSTSPTESALRCRPDGAPAPCNTEWTAGPWGCAPEGIKGRG